VTITLTATSSFNCQSDTSKVFTAFFDKPVADFTVSPTTLCQGITNIFTDNSSAPNSTVTAWDWDFGDGTPHLSTQNPTHRYNAPGSYDINLIVRNTVGCASDPFTASVLVNLQPVVDAGWSFVVPEGTVIRLNPTVNDSSVVSFLWTPQGDIQDPTELRPVFAAMTDQVYTLTATGPGGCSDFDSMSVKILKPFKVPNVFSPNGDNVNDFWVIKNLSDYPGVKVDVYNRYGQLVFTSVGYSQPWDGTYNGKPMPVGTYYYIIKPRNELQPVTGSVTIIR
jgi:gliding motility-associated-like protein